MRRTLETSKIRRNLKAGVALGAVTLAAAFGSNGSALAANKEATASNAYLPTQPTGSLRKRTENRINRRQISEVYDGTLTVQERRQNPRTKRWVTVTSNILNPLLVFRGSLQAESHQDSPTTGLYDFGSVVDKMGRAVVNLVKYDPNTMTLTPGSKAPHVVEGILEGGRGSLEFNQLTDPEGHGNPILLDPASHPERVAYKYTPNK